MTGRRVSSLEKTGGKKNINSRDDLQKRGEERAKRKLEQSNKQNGKNEEEKSEEYRGNTIK